MSIAETEDVLGTAAAWRAAGEQVAVATVTETWGSSPRPAGSQMAVTKSGKMAGSVSGGCIEGAVADAAMKTIDTGTPQLLDFGVTQRARLGGRAGLRRQGEGVRGEAVVMAVPTAQAMSPPLAGAGEGVRRPPPPANRGRHGEGVQPMTPEILAALEAGEARQAPRRAGDPPARRRAAPAARPRRAGRPERRRRERAAIATKAAR